MSRFLNERRNERFKSALALTVKLDQGEGVVRNVSAGGIYFVTDVALKDRQTLNFTLEFQNFPSGPISANCIARIVRLEKQRGRNGVAASINSLEFHRISKAGDH